MKIFVDESFVSGYTTISAIYISEPKINEAYSTIRRILANESPYTGAELKKSVMRRDYKKRSTHKAIAKVMNAKSDRLRFSRKKVKQHTPDFYEMYSVFLRKLKREFPSIEIIVDKFSGFESIENYQDYTFLKSANIKGLQLADIAIDNYSISLEYA